jgi:delta11-fatty-acid desaturase
MCGPAQKTEKNGRFITKIHGRYYDLTDFHHPGGPVALSLAFGRDSTEMFESMHQFADKPKIDALLRKYLIDESKDPICRTSTIESSTVYDWKETLSADFTNDLRNSVEPVLASHQSRISGTRRFDTKITGTKALEILTFLALTIYQYYYFIQGEYYTVFTFPTALWIFTVNVFHDGSHFAVSKYPFINHILTETALLFSTPYTWYHQHIIGHHCFPNVEGKDPDLYHSVKFVRHSKDIRHRDRHKNQPFIFPLLWVVGVPLGLIMRGCIESMAGKPYNKVVKLIPDEAAHIISRKSIAPRLIAIVLLMFVAPLCYHGLTAKGAIFAIMPYLVYSCHFMICSQINHFTPETDEQSSKNFYIHQIVTGHDVAPDSYLMYLYTGGLNLQIEHHLFPTVNHCHLRKLAPVVRAVCAKHGVHYDVSPNLFIALRRHFEHLMKFSLPAISSTKSSSSSSIIDSIDCSNTSKK